MVYSDAAQAALLTWVNTFPLDTEVKSLTDLSDGLILSKVIADIDSTFARRRPYNKPNLQAVIDGVRRFITAECIEIEMLVEAPAFKAISADKKLEDILELVTFLLVAATSGPDRESYIGTIVGLEADVQAEIAALIQQRLAEAQVARESGSDDRTYQVPTSPVSDIELQLEIRYATILKQKRTVEQEKERLQKQMADVTTRLGRLQENNDHLQERLKETEDRLSLPIRDDATARLIKRLEDKIREQDELIEVQEGQFEEDREEKARIRRELEGLRTAATRIIQLEDELKELKFQNVELAKKANTVDRFKQKLEVQKGLEHDLKNLELENEELKFHYRNYNQVKQRNESLEATHLQFQNSIAKAEMEIFEIGSQKKMLDEEKAVLQRSLATLDERRVHDEQFILDLQEQLLSKSSPITKNSLEDELENSDQAARQNNLEVSRLKAENVLLKGNAFAAQENSSLRAQLEEAAAHRKVIETKYRDAFEKEAISQQQLRAMMNSVDDNSKQQAFLDLKNAHIRTTEQLSTLQKNYNAIEAELESTKREYLSATSDLSMVEKEDIDALEELKATQESLSKSFENELTALKSKHRALDIDHELQKSQLIDSLLANSKLRMTFEEESNAEAAASVEKGDAETPMEESDNALQTPNQPDDAEAQKEKMIAELQVRIREFEEGANDAEKAALERENENLKREYGMMTMAWYDLTSRVQSNTVMLQRRSETSKSWINKQRRAVNPTGRR